VTHSYPQRPGAGTNDRRAAGSGGPRSLANQTLSEIDCELQKTMYRATELLKMLRRFHHDPPQSDRIRAEITAVAQWIEFLSAQRLHTMATVEQRPDVVKFGARRVCNNCRKNAKDKRGSTGPKNDSGPPPNWKRQRDFLLSCTQRVGMEVLAQQCASSNLQKFPDCLPTLMTVLLRQQQLLVGTGVAETRIEVNNCSEIGCAVCGGSLDSGSERVS
jgi:hypothetical protein